MTFTEIQEELAKGRKGSGKRALAGRGKTHLHAIDANTIAMKYHETDVIAFTPKHIELNSGGWLTLTTKDRINWGLVMAGVPDRVSQTKKIWYLGHEEFFDGIRVDYSGKVLNARAKAKPVDLRKVNKKLLNSNDYRLAEKLKKHDPEARQIVQKLINSYNIKLSKAIDDGTLSLEMGGGDCWMCIGIFDKDIDHLVSHLKEGYLMLRLIGNALTDKGYRYPGMFICGLKDDKPTPDIETIRQHKGIITSAVRTYFEKKLLTQLVAA